MVRCSKIFGVESQPSSSTTRVPWAKGSISSKPLVVSRPTRRPVREASVLVTAVVPSPKRLTLGRSSSSVVPLRRPPARCRQHALADLPGRRRRLGPPRPGPIGQHAVGEGAADVDADAGANDVSHVPSLSAAEPLQHNKV